MTLHQNIHPSYSLGAPRKWKSVKAQFNGEKVGDCVVLTLADHNEDDVIIFLHYGEKENGQEFVDKLKTAVLSLPAIVGKEAIEEKQFLSFNVKMS